MDLLKRYFLQAESALLVGFIHWPGAAQKTGSGGESHEDARTEFSDVRLK